MVEMIQPGRTPEAVGAGVRAVGRSHRNWVAQQEWDARADGLSSDERRAPVRQQHERARDTMLPKGGCRVVGCGIAWEYRKVAAAAKGTDYRACYGVAYYALALLREHAATQRKEGTMFRRSDIHRGSHTPVMREEIEVRKNLIRAAVMRRGIMTSAVLFVAAFVIVQIRWQSSAEYQRPDVEAGGASSLARQPGKTGSTRIGDHPANGTLDGESSTVGVSNPVLQQPAPVATDEALSARGRDEPPVMMKESVQDSTRLAGQRGVLAEAVGLQDGDGGVNNEMAGTDIRPGANPEEDLPPPPVDMDAAMYRPGKNNLERVGLGTSYTIIRWDLGADAWRGPAISLSTEYDSGAASTEKDDPVARLRLDPTPLPDR